MEGQNETSDELFSLVETGTYQIKSKLKGQPLKEELLLSTAFHRSMETVGSENKEEEKKAAKFSRFRPEEAFEAEIHQVDFHKLMKRTEDKPTPELQEIESRLSELNCDEKNPKPKQVVEGITNEELLLGCAAVYMSSLGEVDDETALEALTNEDSKTLLVALTIGTAKQHVFARLQRYENTGRFRKTSSSSDSDDYLTEEEEEEEEEVEEDEENVFSGVFSDYDCSSCDEDSDGEEDEDAGEVELLTSMIEDFVTSCKERKDRLEKWYNDKKSKSLKPEDIPDELIGVEQRLVAAMTYEVSPESTDYTEKVAVISLLATRRWYQGMGLANKIVSLLGDCRVCGDIDVIIVNVDEGALGFYQRQGFTADVLINLPYSNLHNGWYNTTRMIKFLCDKVKLEQLKCHEIKPLKPCDLYDMKVEMNKLKESDPVVHEKLSIYTDQLNEELLSLNTMIHVRDNEIRDLKHQVSVSADLIAETKREVQAYKDKVASLESSGVKKKCSRLTKRITGKGARKREEMAKRLKKIFNEIKPLHFHMENISPYTFVPENITIAPEETVPSEAQQKKSHSIMSADEFIKKLVSNDVSRSYIKSLLENSRQACDGCVDEETAQFLKTTIIKPLDDELPPPLDDFYKHKEKYDEKLDEKHDESVQQSPADITT